MRGLLESIVTGPAIMHQGAGPVDTQDALQSVAAALWADVVAGEAVGTDPTVEPDSAASDTPARFIGRHEVRLGKFGLDLRVGWLQTLAGAEHDLGASAAAEVDAEERAQGMGDFA